MEQSTLKFDWPKNVIEQTCIFNSKAVKVEDYKDLGTWKEISKLLSKTDNN